jgi:hypothetical protein
VRLEKTIVGLERERTSLATQLEAHIITNEQIQTIEDFAAQVKQGLEAAEDNFETRLRLADMLDVQMTLAIENGEYVAYVQCLVDEARLLVVSNHTGTDSLRTPRAPASPSSLG